jgi:hypothetical protein
MTKQRNYDYLGIRLLYHDSIDIKLMIFDQSMRLENPPSPRPSPAGGSPEAEASNEKENPEIVR